jgi:hypothetical protein
MEEKHPLNRTKEVSVDVVPSVDANSRSHLTVYSTAFCAVFSLLIVLKQRPGLR